MSSSNASNESREMVTPMQRKALTKEGYKIIGTHSAVKLCRWTKHQLRGRYIISRYLTPSIRPSITHHHTIYHAHVAHHYHTIYHTPFITHVMYSTLCYNFMNGNRFRGGCYKHTFYGITSYQCMEATPSLACANKCVFCWRHHKNPGIP